MSTTETQQDAFTLAFLHWFKNNFEEIADDVYRDVKDPAPIQKDTMLWTAAECLAHYRKQCIPPLPIVRHTEEEHEALTHLAEEIRKMNLFFISFQKIRALLDNAEVVPKEPVNAIILETLLKITSPA